jgi:hypothetical protein
MSYKVFTGYLGPLSKKRLVATVKSIDQATYYYNHALKTRGAAAYIVHVETGITIRKSF